MLLENYLQRLVSFLICALYFIIDFSCIEDLYMVFGVVVRHAALLHAFMIFVLSEFKMMETGNKLKPRIRSLTYN